MVRGGVAVAVAVGGDVVGAEVAAGVSLGAGVAVGATVRGAIVNEAEGEAVADADGEGVVGGAICCDARIAPPSRSKQTRASAAKTVNTVDQRSAGGRPLGGGGGAALATTSGGGSIRSVASARSGFSCIAPYDRTLRAERTPARLAAL